LEEAEESCRLVFKSESPYESLSFLSYVDA
jgi:hypothetical protein